MDDGAQKEVAPSLYSAEAALARAELEDRAVSARDRSSAAFRRALLASVVVPLTVVAEIPLRWILLDAWQLDALFLVVLAVCVVLWGRWGALYLETRVRRSELLDDDP